MKEITAVRPHRIRRRGLLAAGIAAAALAALVGVTVGGRDGDAAWAAEAVRVAEAAPRLLVGAPGWEVARADQFSADYGEMTFRNGTRELELRWEQGSRLASKLADRASSADLVTTLRIAGTQARVFRYEGTNDFTAVWPWGEHGLEARGLASNVEAFEGLVATLHEVDVDAWLSAMPESVVKPVSRGEVVAQMLEGLPLPPGFDTSGLTSGDAVRDRYQLGAQVSGAVACAWIELWLEARRTGDDAGVRRAVAALSGSHDWKVLREMEPEGAYPQVLREYADAVATGAPVPAGKPMGVAESYEQALGCP